ncbi:hypothetical protein EDC04DRAFT_2603383 [Pisolithus marmoratus]|nr:hypothetical protein EDC04DRAFT_2603383 [Pisolithus marmoratus]
MIACPFLLSACLPLPSQLPLTAMSLQLDHETATMKGHESMMANNSPGLRGLDSWPAVNNLKWFITCDLKDHNPPLHIGHFTDHAGLSLAAQNTLNSSELAFKSKVISHARVEIHLENRKFFIHDTKALSRTFLGLKQRVQWELRWGKSWICPVALTMHYGQNQDLHKVPNATHTQRENWNKDHDYSNIMLFSFSLASHINFSLVDQWANVPPEVILAWEGQEIDDLQNYNLLDEDGKEIPIYMADGYTVLRHAPPNDGSMPGGAFLDLTKVPNLFIPEDEEEDFNICAVPCYLYPLAFTKTLGNMQADGLIHSFQQQLPMINGHLSTHIAGHDEDDNDSLFGDIAYNALSHHVQDKSKFHSVQLGRITAAVAGCTATGAHSVTKWRWSLGENNLSQCDFRTPICWRYLLWHQRIKMAVLYIYDKVITPLLRTWSHPDVQRSVRAALVPLAADVVPGIFEWTTCPITCFLELSWNNLLPQLQQPDVAIDPHVIEMISVFECVLNYAHTGAARVLTRALMGCTWTSLGLMFDGFPCVWGHFVNHDELEKKNIQVYSKQWPIDEFTQCPMSSSCHVQELTYGNKHYESYIAHFTILHAMKNLPQHVYVEVGDPSKCLTCFAAEVGLQVYIADVKYLVFDAVSNELHEFRDVDDHIHAELVNSRHLALQRWSDSQNPLSYTESTLMDLIRAVSDHRDEDPHLQDPAVGTQTLSFFVDKIIAACKKGNSCHQPPFIQDGKALPVLKITVSEIECAAISARVPAESMASFISQAFILACWKLKINHIPWVPARDGGPGAPTTHISHKVWLSIGAAEPPPVADSLAGDPSGAWSALQVKLVKFHTVLHKAVLPTECTMANVTIPKSSPAYISDMYQWVLQNFDMAKPIHFLALFASTAFAGLVPANHSSSGCSFPGDHSEESWMQYIQSLPWIEKDRKGSTYPTPFIFMFTAYILGFYEPSSPVGQRIHNGECLRKWLEKNTAKGMTLLTLCCFGLASPRSNGVFHAGEWGKDVIALSDSTLVGKHDAVVKYLHSSSEYGAFDAIQYLAGTTTAQYLLPQIPTTFIELDDYQVQWLAGTAWLCAVLPTHLLASHAPPEVHNALCCKCNTSKGEISHPTHCIKHGFDTSPQLQIMELEI